VDGQVLGVVRVPLYFVDKEMARWLYANQSLDFTLSNNPKQERGKSRCHGRNGRPARGPGPGRPVRLLKSLLSRKKLIISG